MKVLKILLLNGVITNSAIEIWNRNVPIWNGGGRPLGNYMKCKNLT